jgi:hypothetical protein
MYQTEQIANVRQRSSFLTFLMERNRAVSVLIGCLIVGASLSNNSVSEAAQKPNPVNQHFSELSRHRRFEFASTAITDAQAYENDKQQQIKLCAQREQARQKRAEAGAKMIESRKYYQFFWQEQWNQVIWTNLPSFDAGRLAAAQAAGGHTPCTVCGSHSKLDHCILCKDSGKCPGCNGTGETSSNQTCPTCLGNGHCFLCAGTGKMTCPFCDDGEISAHQHEPSTVIPVN